VNNRARNQPEKYNNNNNDDDDDDNNGLFNRFHEVALRLLKLSTILQLVCTCPPKKKKKMTKTKNVFKNVLKKNYIMSLYRFFRTSFAAEQN